MRIFFTIILLIIFGAWAVICIVLSLITSLLFFSKEPTFYFAQKIWTPGALFLMGAKLKITGAENIIPNHPYIVMSNHTSYLDIPALLKSVPLRLHFIAKKELRVIPFLGWYLMLSDTILIDRKNTTKAKESLSQAAQLINRGRHVAMYPEGTTSKTGKLNSLKKGGFYLAEDAKAYIIPVHIKGTYDIWPSANKLKIKPGPVEVVIGKPISPDELNELPMDQRTELVRQKILEL
jgi:1-acyl-sn-glycerol-3-phosphate acyltransferase